MKKLNSIVSEKWKLIWPDFKKGLIGLSYTVIGAAAAWLSQYLGMIDLGVYQPFLAAPVSFVCYMLKKLATESEYKATSLME